MTHPSTYLVTGGAGFIGSHLVDHLLAAGHAVHVLDDLSSGKRGNVAPGARFTQGSITDAQTVREACEGADGVFHLAAIASVARCNEFPRETHAVNVTGTRHVFASAIAQDIPVIYTSSAAVYGDKTTVPLAETVTPTPLGPYGQHKRENELQAAAMAAQGLRALGIRPFNVYGPRQDPTSSYSGVISIFCQRVRENEAIVLHGDGAQTRDFIEVGDVVMRFSRAMRHLHGHGTETIFNACTGQTTSIRALASLLMVIAQQDVPLRETVARAGDIRYSCGNPARSHDALALPPCLPLHEGLARLWKSLE